MKPGLIYTGLVRHRRYAQRKHSFSYKTLMFYFDIGAITETFNHIKRISIERFNWFSFRRKDYLNEVTLSLDEAARKLVKDKLGVSPKGKIYLLTQLACLGYCFNPISLYFVFKEGEDVIETLIVEVTNTPWNEKHIYVQHLQPSLTHKNIYICSVKKALHVSPFLTMDYIYNFNIKLNDQQIIVHMENIQNGERHFDATLSLKGFPIEKSTIESLLRRYPFGSYKILAAIYWQALKLLLKGVTFRAHPGKP